MSFAPSEFSFDIVKVLITLYLFPEPEVSFAPSEFFVLVFIPEPEVEFPSFRVLLPSKYFCVYSLFCFLRFRRDFDLINFS